MKRILSLLPVLYISLLSCTSGVNRAGESGPAAVRAARIDSLVTRELDPDGPGCAVAVYQDGAITFEKGYGLANLDWRLPVTPATVFDIASISKQFTAACILMLADRGMLSLHDDIHQFIPEFPNYGTRIEIQHLLHHTSGIRDWVWLLALGGIPFENILSRQDLYRIISRQQALAFAPSEQYQYSNSGYNLLALIVERITGMTFEGFVNKEIFQPLGMKHTRILSDRRQIIGNRAFGYLPTEDGGYCLEQYFTPALVGSSNIHTDVEDLFLWDQNYYSPKVGPPDLANRMEERGILNSGDTIAYACGLEIRQYRGLKTVSHGGDWAGFLACQLRFPEQRFTVICLANTQAISPSNICHKIADLFLAQRYDQAENTPPEERPVERTVVAVDPALYDDYAGVYEADDGRKISIRNENGRLSGFVVGERRFEILPSSANEFFLKSKDVLITFARDEQGLISRLEWKQGQQTVTYFSLKNRLPGSLSVPNPAEYAGDYFSAELQVRYNVAVQDGGLVLNNPIKSRYLMDATGITGSNPLKPLEKDKFRFAFLYLNFERGAGGVISGFTLIHQWAALKLKFVKS